jgi:hypothetical protein
MEYIENTVQSEEEDVMNSDVLNILEFIYHEKLRENG